MKDSFLRMYLFGQKKKKKRRRRRGGESSLSGKLVTNMRNSCAGNPKWRPRDSPKDNVNKSTFFRFFFIYLYSTNSDKMSQGKRFVRALSRIGYPKADEFEGDSLEWLFDCESLVPFLEWFCENIHETNVLSQEDLNRYI